MRLSDSHFSAYSVHLFLCRSTKSCKVIESSKLSQALFISTQTSRVVHSLLWVQNPGSSTQGTGAVEPSVTSMISVSHISEGGRASVNPPEAPRALFTRPADLRGINSCSRYPRDILCLSEISFTNTGPSPRWRAKSSIVRAEYLPFVESLIADLWHILY